MADSSIKNIMIKKKKILVIGDVMLDRYWMGQVNRISPEAPVPILDVINTTDKPGGAANVAKNLADFGMDVTLIGLTGKDEASQKISNLLSSTKIKYMPVVDSKIRTTITFRRCFSTISEGPGAARKAPKTTSIFNDLLMQQYNTK